MNTREIAKEYRLSHWAGIMQERVTSGLTIKDFCESKQMHENVYYYWQRRLREAACQELLPMNHSQAEKGIVPNGWSVCAIAESEAKSDTISVGVGKFRIMVNDGVNPDLLERVCKVLVTLC